MDSSKVTHLSIKSTQRNFWSEDALLQFLNNCPQLTSLSMEKVDCFSCEVLSQLDVNLLQQLRELRITAYCPSFGFEFSRADHLDEVADYTLTFLARHCNSLKKLYLNHYFAGSENYIEMLLQRNPRLQHLELFVGEEFSHGFLQTVATCCPQLVECVLRGYKHIILNHNTVQAVTSLEGLKSLRINVDQPQYKSINYSTHRTAQHSSTLRVERLKKHTTLSDLLTSLLDFRALSLVEVNVGSGDESVLPLIAEHSPQLQQLELHDISNTMEYEEIVLLLESCEHLHTLKVAKLSIEREVIVVADDGAEDEDVLDVSIIDPLMALLCDDDQDCRLERISISHDPHITYDDVISLLVLNTHLKQLWIHKCDEITEAQICDIKQYIAKQKLNVLFTDFEVDA